jgi:hypothetical protein
LEATSITILKGVHSIGLVALLNLTVAAFNVVAPFAGVAVEASY